MNNLEKEFTPYNEALALKELGFDEPCLAYWDDDKVFELNPDFLKGSQMDDTWLTAPTFSQIFRFFREKYKITSSVRAYFAEEFFYEIYVNIMEEITSNSFKTYEEAELACLKKLIEIVKNK